MRASDVSQLPLHGRRRSLSQGSASDSLNAIASVQKLESSQSKIMTFWQRSKPQLLIEGIHDIDKNLHFREGEYNAGLGEAFKTKKITRNVFCTDMASFTELEILTRCKVRDYYTKQYKFDIYAIITPADYAWHLDAKLLSDFFMECITHRIDLRTQRYVERIDEILENPYFEKIAFLIKPNKTQAEMNQMFSEQAKAGTTFDTLEPLYKKIVSKQTRVDQTIELPEKRHAQELAEKAHHAKWIADIAAFKAKLSGIKGLVLSKFFKDNETSVCGFAFTDDKQEEIDAVIIESARWPNARVTGIVTPTDIKNCTKKYYQTKLEAWMSHSSSPSSDEETSSQRISGSITPPARTMKNKSSSAGESPEEKLPPDTHLRASQVLGKFG